jgi:hypothetical protein
MVAAWYLCASCSCGRQSYLGEVCLASVHTLTFIGAQNSVLGAHGSLTIVFVVGRITAAAVRGVVGMLCYVCRRYQACQVMVVGCAADPQLCSGYTWCEQLLFGRRTSVL